MRTLTALLFAIIALASCSGIDSLKYHDQIYAAHEDLLKQYEKLDRTFNEQTGNPEGAALLQKEITTFSYHTDSIITHIKSIEKLDDDFFKTAFINFATELKNIANTDYKSLTPLTAVKQESFTEAMQVQEEATTDAINKKLDALNDGFLKQQEVFAKKYDITLH